MKIFYIKFRKTKKVYPFFLDNSSLTLKRNDFVIVETIRGDQIGVVLEELSKDKISELLESEIKIRSIKKKLSIKEIEKLEDLDKKAYFDFFKCKKIVKEFLPEMNLVAGEYPLDENRLIFYFTSNDKLDFRILVKKVTKFFKKRVEFYQIKENDEGRMLSAFGKYGKEIYW